MNCLEKFAFEINSTPIKDMFGRIWHWFGIKRYKEFLRLAAIDGGDIFYFDGEQLLKVKTIKNGFIITENIDIPIMENVAFVYRVNYES